MPPPPIYRWKTFTLGLIPLAFIVWAWLSSLHHGTELMWATTDKETTFTSMSGWFGVYEITEQSSPAFPNPGSGFIPATPGITTTRHPIEHPVVWLPAFDYTDARIVNVDLRIRTLSITWWLITLAYLLPWLATLALLHRRQRKLLENTTL